MTRLNESGRMPLLVGAIILVSVLSAIGCVLVPSHWTSIWMDREFTGWVAPIANRIGMESRMYEHGMHNPMPPLPAVLMRILFPGGATWYDESLLNYLFQSLTICVLFLAFARQWSVGVGLSAGLAAIPVFFNLPKTILYDSMAQFLVASIGVAAVSFRQIESGRFETKPRLFWCWLAGTGFLIGLLMLTKQSTGTGAALGVSFLIMLDSRWRVFPQRVGNLCVCGIAAVITLCLGALIMKSWISFGGLLNDVFITGSQPKGGARVLVTNIARQVAAMAVGGLVTGLLFFSFAFGLRRWVPALGHILREPFGMTQSAVTTEKRFNELRPCFAALALASVIGFAAIVLFPYGLERIQFPSLLQQLPRVPLNVGLLFCFLSMATLGLKRWGKTFRPEAGYALIFLFSALFHSLSVKSFRWTFDNNPLVLLALAFFARGCFSIQQLNFKKAIAIPRSVTALLLGLFILAMWPNIYGQVYCASLCTQRWPEVRYLQSARLRPESEGMRELVQSIKSLVDPQKDEAVLLLPNDPNVEAWFERPRPKLSSAIIFVDQYWDRFVAEDFAELKRQPPKVIVIGPRNHWRNFTRLWHPGWGAERLIDLVQTDLLPNNYLLHQEQRISFSEKPDFMDVYVRRDQ